MEKLNNRMERTEAGINEVKDGIIEIIQHEQKRKYSKEKNMSRNSVTSWYKTVQLTRVIGLQERKEKVSGAEKYSKK